MSVEAAAARAGLGPLEPKAERLHQRLLLRPRTCAPPRGCDARPRSRLRLLGIVPIAIAWSGAALPAFAQAPRPSASEPLSTAELARQLLAPAHGAALEQVATIEPSALAAAFRGARGEALAAKALLLRFTAMESLFVGAVLDSRSIPQELDTEPAAPEKSGPSFALLCALTSLAGIFVGFLLFLLRDRRRSSALGTDARERFDAQRESQVRP